MTVAILCAARNSVYKEFDGVEVFDIDRDARTFDDCLPVVCHPPCRAWSAFCAHQAKPLLGEKDLAPWCVDKLRENGGVLEHPAHSRLWRHLNLPLPGEEQRGGMWSLAVKQSWWGDTRSKNTWLLFSGIERSDLPDIPFRLHDPANDTQAWNKMSKHQRAATPKRFAEWLIEVARRTSR